MCKHFIATMSLHHLGSILSAFLPMAVLSAVALLSASSAWAQQRTFDIPGEDASESALETIIVTAEKRSEALKDVPISVTAISGSELTRTESTRFEDYIGKVPGMTLIEVSPVQNQLVLRGITMGSASINSSVAAYLDETPYTSEGPFANSGISPNLDTYDLQRIEVLRGPQGTLYGSLALGGLLKYVTNAPDPTHFAASAQTGFSSVDHGGEGYNLHAMVNLPLAGDAALRVVGYDSYYPGYIDDPSRGLTDINGSHVVGGRVSLLYPATETFSARFNVLYQRISAGDSNYEDVHPGTLAPIHGNLTQERLISQPSETENELYNTTVNWDLGFATLLSSTSYAHTPFSEKSDLSGVYAPIVSSIFGAPYGAALAVSEPVETYTQEIRISSNPKERFEWQAGGFFTHEQSKEYEQIWLIDPATHQILYNFPVGLATYHITPTYREFAGFANLDYHFTPTFDVAFGGRYSTNRQSYSQTSKGAFSGTTDISTSSSQGVFTYSGDARWHWTPQTMLYARIATGFVPGGPNDVLPGSTLSESYSSSKTTNYEMGIKSGLFDHRVSLDVAVFDINWKDIQLEALVGTLYGIVNGGTARSDGVEWNFGYAPIDGLTLNFNGAYTNARLTQATPSSVSGHDGAFLPDVPQWSGAVSADYERPLFGDCSGFMGTNWRYSGSRYSDFTATGPRQHMPSYNIVDLRAGIGTRKWTATLYVKNVGDKIAFSTVQANTLAGGLGPQYATVFHPRTFGVDLSVKF
jgi:iron complex outermembrane receptor protein